MKCNVKEKGGNRVLPEVQNRSRVFYTLATSVVKNIDILIFFSILKSKSDTI